MTINELAALLNAEGFRPDCYDLTGEGGSESYVISEDRGSWSVFYHERGLETGKRTFASESLACDDLLSRLRADPKTKQA